MSQIVRIIAAVLLGALSSQAALAQHAAGAVPARVNPFFAPSSLPYQYPPFDKIRDTDYREALVAGIRIQDEEIAAIATQSAKPTFDNTIVALEQSGQLLARVRPVFENMVQMNTSDILDKTERDMLPQLAIHENAMLTNAKLFERVRGLYDDRANLHLDRESQRLLERCYIDFVRAGAKLSDASKRKLQDLNAELSLLQANFTQNLIKESIASALVVDTRAELAGLSPAAIDAAAAAASAAGQPGKFLITLGNSTNQGKSTQLDNPAVRAKLLALALDRGSHGGPYDSRELVRKIATLRAQKAALLGYPDFATYALEVQTVQTPARLNALLDQLVGPVLDKSKREGAAVQAFADSEHKGVHVTAADWTYYGAKLRAREFSVDENRLRPYFELNSVLTNGVFYAAQRLYGISLKERFDLPVFDSDVRVWDVIDADGTQLGIFVGDYHARNNKTVGGSTSEYVSQSTLRGTHTVVVNHMSLAKPLPGQPTLLTSNDVATAFHEFGHAMHALFSNVKYARFAGTNVPNDFVEYPSQTNEMWALWPEVVANYAKHYQTGEAIPAQLLSNLIASQNFDQGRRMNSILASVMLDQRWHELKPDHLPTDVLAFEASALRGAGFDPALVPPAYRSTYFMHTFGGEYAAVFYSYIWAGRLQGDTVAWFKQNGGLRRENGDWFRKTVLARGGAEDAYTIYRQFRGAEPGVAPLLTLWGMDADPAAPGPAGKPR